MARITLKPGDYVSTKGLNEDDYHAVARAFIEAGAESGEYPEPDYIADDMGDAWAFGSLHGSLWHGIAACFKGRHLTPQQVVSATNATKKEEITMTPCEKMGYKVGDRFTITGSSSFTDGSTLELFMDDGDDCPLFRLINGYTKYNLADGKRGAHADLTSVSKIESLTTSPIQALKQRRKERDDAEAAYQEALKAVREELGDGFTLDDNGAPVRDLPPEKWREGDVVEALESAQGTKRGRIYKAEIDPSDGELSYKDDDGDWCSFLPPSHFRFHSRPA